MRVFGLILGVCFSVCGWGDEYWLFDEQFVKFGKRGLYEAQAQKGAGVAFQDVDNPRYIYLRKGSCEDAGLNKSAVLESALNFSIETLNLHLKACSFVPKGKTDFFNYSRMHSYVLGVTPGDGHYLEEHLQKLTQKSKVCFTTWKVVLGAELPKYVVYVFGNSEKEVEEFDMKFDDLNDVIRTKKEGNALLRKDLSS